MTIINVKLHKAIKYLHKFFFGQNGYDSKKESINIIESIAKCKVLYKRLMREAHPDKHPDNVALAEEISKQINENRHNYAKLLELESRIKTELV